MYEIYLASEKDLALYKQFQIASWGEEGCPDEKTLLSRLNLKSCVFFLKKNNQLIGSSTFIQLREYDFNNPMSWYETTGNGTCSTHDPMGEIGFGVDISLINNEQSVGFDASSAILNATAQLCAAKNLKCGIFGGRLISYSKYVEKYPDPNDYLFKKVRNRYLDPHVQMCTKLVGLTPLKVIPNYFEDPLSLNYGVLYRWNNPFYDLKKHLSASKSSFKIEKTKKTTSI